MGGQSVEQLGLGQMGDPGELSVIALALRADIIVQGVMLLLLVSSVWCWAIILDKWLRFRRLRSQADRFEDEFWAGGSLEELYDRIPETARHPMELLFASAMREWRRSTSRESTSSTSASEPVVLISDAVPASPVTMP